VTACRGYYDRDGLFRDKLGMLDREKRDIGRATPTGWRRLTASQSGLDPLTELRDAACGLIVSTERRGKTR